MYKYTSNPHLTRHPTLPISSILSCRELLTFQLSSIASPITMKLGVNFLSTLLVVLLSNPGGLFVSDVAAHGAMETPQELARRAEHIADAKRSLAKCAAKLRTRDRLEQRIRRRNALVDKFVQLKKRDGINSEFHFPSWALRIVEE